MKYRFEMDTFELLTCPVTKLGLKYLSRSEAEGQANGKLVSRPDMPNASGDPVTPAGVSDFVLLRDDKRCAYPVIEGVPLLLAPEMLAFDSPSHQFDLCDHRYAEAYEEMEFYNTRASETLRKLEETGAWGILPTEMAASAEERETFPEPWARWADSTHDLASQMDSYRHLGQLKGKRILQLGGSGTHAIKFAMAGADEAWLVTPMLAEATIGRALAESAGVGDRFRAVVGIAEELPFKDATFDGIYSGGSLHHTVTELSFAEANRILRPGGKFAAAEPWRAPLYGMGTRLLGKREDAYCRPLTKERIKPLTSIFKESRIVRHGTLFRYAFIGFEKFGLRLPKRMVWYVGRVDDALSSFIPGLRGYGSSVAVLGEK